MKAPWLALLAAFLILGSGCSRPSAPAVRTVVVYASIDQVVADPIFERFEKETGIRVNHVYDVEASKTTGLVARIVAEREKPRADVFWNGEFAQTLQLADEGLLASYAPDGAKGLPSGWRQEQGLWTAFGGRARVFLIRKGLPNPPKSMLDIPNLEKKIKVGMAIPLFGTTATQASAMYAILGPEKGKAWFQAVLDRGTQILDGNAAVREAVVAGRLDVGITDSDDALVALSRNASVEVIVPDLAGNGALVIPETVALLNGAPHSEEARRLLDFLASRETESALTEGGFCQLPLRVDTPTRLSLKDTKRLDLSLEALAAPMTRALDDLRPMFVR